MTPKALQQLLCTEKSYIQYSTLPPEVPSCDVKNACYFLLLSSSTRQDFSAMMRCFSTKNAKQQFNCIQLQVSRQVKKTNKNTTKSLSTSIFKNKKGCFLTLRCQSSVKILQIGVPEVPLHWHLCIFGHPPAWPKSPRMGTLGQGMYGGFGVVFSHAKKHLQMVQ